MRRWSARWPDRRRRSARRVSSGCLRRRARAAATGSRRSSPRGMSCIAIGIVEDPGIVSNGPDSARRDTRKSRVASWPTPISLFDGPPRPLMNCTVAGSLERFSAIKHDAPIRFAGRVVVEVQKARGRVAVEVRREQRAVLREPFGIVADPSASRVKCAARRRSRVARACCPAR